MSPDKGFKFQTQERGLASYRIETTTPHEDLQVILGEVAAKVQLTLMSETQGAKKELGINAVTLKIRQSGRDRPQDGGVFHDLSIEVGYPSFEDSPSPLAIKWAARIRDAIVEVMRGFGVEDQILNIQLHAQVEPKGEELAKEIEIDLETIPKAEWDRLVARFEPRKTIIYWLGEDLTAGKWIKCFFLSKNGENVYLKGTQDDSRWKGCNIGLVVGLSGKLKINL